jgi:hypothetical protein
MATISFTNAIANVKEGSTIDVDRMRDHRVFGKLMLAKGQRFGGKKVLKDFILSESGNFIAAELFFVNSKGTILPDNRVFLHVHTNTLIIPDELNRFYYVELIHPQLTGATDKAFHVVDQTEEN